ncbi:MAG: HAD-IC family P-type ATPase [Planctomycetota bacterium]|nr:HAD-IC family P-type ATPase [Planctomycetota bacterium]
MKKAPTVGESIAWHAESIEDVLRRVESSPDGLGSSEARRRLEVAGPNELPRARRVPFWWVFLRQFHSPLIYILAAAALFSVVINELTDASFIGVVLLINAIIGSIQEWRAEKANQSLQKLIVTRAAVTRDGETIELPAAELVPGDVVWLESGNRVPADMRLLSAHSLEVDESLLTGESLSVLKDPEWPRVTHATLGDRKNMCFAGSVVARGRGAGLVVETGGRTAVGRLALDLSARGGGKPPLLLRLERFTRLIGVAVLAAAAMVALLGVLLQGKTAGEMFMVAVALAVSAIPEGLPVTLTVVLAIATARMARRGVVVRKLAAVEGLGSCTLVASDKTGTLTCNELTVHVALLPDETEYAVSGAGYSPHGEVRRDDAVVNAGELPALAALTRACMLCNEGSLHRAGEEWHWHGDPTDIALLAFGIKAGCSHEQLELQYPQLNQIPFEAEHKFAATFHRAPGAAPCAAVKGAPERVLDMCSWDAAEETPPASAWPTTPRRWRRAASGCWLSRRANAWTPPRAARRPIRSGCVSWASWA